MARGLSDTDIARLAAAVTPTAAETPERWLDQATRRRVIVHTHADSMEGTLILAAEDGLLLWSAQLVTDGQPVPLAGEVFVPKEQVLFVQTVRM